MLVAAFSIVLIAPALHSPVLRIVFIVLLLVLPNLRTLSAAPSTLPPNSDMTGIAGKKAFAKERAAILKRAEKDARFSDKKSNTGAAPLVKNCCKGIRSSSKLAPNLFTACPAGSIISAIFPYFSSA